jgi:hypothetical protein
MYGMAVGASYVCDSMDIASLNVQYLSSSDQAYCRLRAECASHMRDTLASCDGINGSPGGEGRDESG